MAREFYTEKDIEDMIRQGVKSLEVTANVSLTALAYEKAQKLGLLLVKNDACPPDAPIRPYLSESSLQKPIEKKSGEPCGGITPCPDTNNQPGSDLKTRIRQAVLQRIGNQVDPVLLDQVIERVLVSTGMGQK